MTIRYQINLAEPEAHEFEIVLSFQAPAGTPIRVTLPAWIPGSYMIRDFARNLLDVRAHDSHGSLLPLRKTDKQTWLLSEVEGQVQISYRVYAFDESVRSAYFDNTRAYFNGTSLFLRVNGADHDAHEVHIVAPGAGCMQDWRIATSMPAVAIDAAGFGIYRADGYAHLIDHPFEISAHAATGFELQGIRHDLVFVDAPGADLARIARDLAPICAEHVAMFGDLPVSRYLFMALATAAGYGGLEHRESTSLMCKRSDLPYANTTKIGKGYRTFLALCSHEYFHLWNVKRIAPAAVSASDLAAEAHTELLWAFEGITSYYDELALPRSGVIARDDYLDMLAPAVTRYLRNPGRQRQSVAESSFDAWTKFYKQDENAPNAIVSYYNKGALVALGLDQLIRTRSDERLSLDDLMRLLWRRYGQTGQGVPERAIERELAELLGAPVERFFAAYVYGTEELPLEAWLAGFGVGMRRRSAKDAADQGGFSTTPGDPVEAGAVLLATTEEQAGILRLTRVLAGGAAQQAGLCPGDQLLAIDGERCTEANLPELLGRKPLGESVEITYFRRDRLQQGLLPLLPAPPDTCDLYWLEDVQLEPIVQARRETWLRSAQEARHASG
jgi:predicted metalloprotease with PDZ domain